MPIKIPDNLPAKEILENENIFVMRDKQAYQQDIRPLQLVILNLMPLKIQTETHLLRLLGNTPLQTDIVLIHPKSHRPKNTSVEHLKEFYDTFDDIKHRKFDGLIITGAPVEQLNFEDVDYWNELKEIMDWKVNHVTSTLHICWGAQAGLYHHFGIQKYPLERKVSGIFPHRILKQNVKLMRGFDEIFYAPHSRFTENRMDDIAEVPELEILSDSEEAGVYLVATKDGRQIFVVGHSEYDRDTLKREYERDVERRLNVDIPKNYFPGDDITKRPLLTWRSHANLLFYNWLNYYVYQQTPFDINEIR